MVFKPKDNYSRHYNISGNFQNRLNFMRKRPIKIMWLVGFKLHVVNELENNLKDKE